MTGKGIQTVEGSEVDGSKAEVNYCKILNKSLPPEIKFYCWADVEPGFSARFDCDRRTYRYFLPAGSLNVPAMQNAADRLIGLHDFRNFSKLDRTKLEQTFTRHIHAVCIRRLNETSDSNDLLVLEISGKAFLWHQIRCIVAILLLVGEEKEKPEIMSDLLDTELYARKPQYPLASELPLVLFDCGFDRIEPFDWIYDAEAIADAIDHLQSQYVELTTKTAIVTSMITELKALPITLPTIPLQKYLLPSLRSANHQPIATRPVSETQLSEVGEQRVRNNIKHRSIAKMIDYDQSEKKIKITPDVK